MINTNSNDTVNPSLTEAQLSQTNRYFLYDPILLSRHRHAIPQREAYLFFPAVKDQVIENSRKPEKTLRMIFTNVTFLEYENRKLCELHERIRQLNAKNCGNRIVFPKWWKESDSRRFLQATSFNLDKTLDYIAKQIHWKETYFPFQITDNVIEILNSGFMYICGRDCHYRPVLIIHARSFFDIKDKFAFSEIFMAIIYFLEYVINNMMIVGQIENWIMITDISKVSLLFMPSDLKKIVSALSSTYRCRLYRNYIIGMNAGLRFLAKIFMSFLDPVTVSKNRFLDESNKVKELTTFIHPRNIEEKYGGSAPNIGVGLHTFFPPVMPTLQFEKDEKLIVSEEEYRRRCFSKEEKPFVVCKEMEEEWEEERRRKEREEQERRRTKEYEEMQQSARLKSTKSVVKSAVDVLLNEGVSFDSKKMDRNYKSSNCNNTVDTKCSNKSGNNSFAIHSENVQQYFKVRNVMIVNYSNKSCSNIFTSKRKGGVLMKHKKTVGNLIGMSRINCTSPTIFHRSFVNANTNK